MKRIVTIALASLAVLSAPRAPAQASYSGGSLNIGGSSFSLDSTFYDHIIGSLLSTQTCANGVGSTATNGVTPWGDPIIVATANEVRRVDDLEVWSPVGLRPLQWTRWANSRLPWNTSNPFGYAHNWRHGYQWQLEIAYTATGSVATLHEPQGTWHRFAEPAESSDPWNPITYAATLRFNEDEDGFFTTLNDGTQVRFELERATSTGETWRPTTVRDADGNLTTITYNTSGRPIRYADAGGHYLDVTWTNLPLWSTRPGTLKTITTAPPAGQWVDILLTNAPSSRFVRFYSADGFFARIADMEVYVNGSATPATGTLFGAPPSDTSHAIANAFDGDGATYFEAAATNGGFVGIDLGSNAQPTRIR